METNQMIFFTLLAVVAIISLAVLSYMATRAVIDNKTLHEWRGSLKKGDPVRAEGYGEHLTVHTISVDSITVHVFTKNGEWYRRVDLQDVYPVEDSVEWEVVHE